MSERHVVQPMGKYGQAYVLGKSDYIIYRTIFGLLAFVMLALFFLILAPSGQVGIFAGISHNRIVITGFLIAILGIGGLTKFAAAKGQATFEGREKETIEISIIKNIPILIGLFGASVFVLLTGITLIMEGLFSPTIDPRIVVIFTVFCLMDWILWKKSPFSKRKP